MISGFTGADLDEVERTTVPVDLEPPVLTGLEVRFDVASEPLGLVPSRGVVGQIDAPVILVRLRTLNVEEVARHLKAAKGESSRRPFLDTSAVKVAFLELGNAFQFLEIQQRDSPAFPSYEISLSQFLKRPVDVYHGET